VKSPESRRTTLQWEASTGAFKITGIALAQSQLSLLNNSISFISILTAFLAEAALLIQPHILGSNVLIFGSSLLMNNKGNTIDPLRSISALNHV
jgi:hypothetical protein